MGEYRLYFAYSTLCPETWHIAAPWQSDDDLSLPRLRGDRRNLPIGYRFCSSIHYEFEPAADRRQQNVALSERFSLTVRGGAVLPPTILTEAVAQVGAILILAKPENRDRLPYFVGIERVRYRRPVHPGDVVEIEAVVKRLRTRMGVMHGIARVAGQIVVEGTMTFALGQRNEGA